MAEKSYEYAVLGDIGGTNARLELAKIIKGAEEPEVVKCLFYTTNNHKGGLEEILEHFLYEFRDTEQYPKLGVIAVPCPINDNIAEKFANSIWPRIDGNEVAKKFGLSSVTLLNDFAAIGHAIGKIKQKDLVDINKGRVSPLDIKVIVGPGTGLGVTYVSHGKNEKGEIIDSVHPTEGGHTQFPIADEEEAEWREYYMKRDPKWTYFHTEHAFCGPRIPIMYDFFNEKEGITEHTKMNAKEIFALARDGKDASARKTLDFFLKIYGEVLSNIAISFMPLGGIYLVGGLTVSLKDEILREDSPFRKAFFNKGFLNKELSMVDIKIVQIVELGLLGCFSLASKKIFA